MRDYEDILEIGGRRILGPGGDGSHPAGRGPVPARAGTPFLGVHFACCHVYGRLTRNRAGTMYLGRCPRCGSPVEAVIGPDGTGQRFFEAR